MASKYRVFPDPSDPPVKPGLGLSDGKDWKNPVLPPPATYHYAPYRTARRRCCSCCSCLGGRAWPCLIGVVICVGVIVGAIYGITAFIYALVVQPQLPNFNLQNVRVTGFNGTIINSTELNTGVSFTLVARNPNRMLGLHYANMSISVETRKQRIGDGTIGGFYQGHKNTTVLYVDTEYKGSTSQGAISKLNAENRNSFGMKVKMDVKTRTRLSSSNSHKFKLKVRCHLTVDLMSAGTPILDSDCDTKTDCTGWWW